MSRSKRILAHARREGWLGAVWFSVATASGVWAAVAWMERSIPGGMLLSTIAAAALLLGSWHWGERRRLICRVLASELAWHPEPAPGQTRELNPWAVALATLAVMAAITAAVHLI